MQIDNATIYVNGQLEIILNNKDIVDIARMTCGNDYAQVIEQLASASDYNELLAEKKFDSDFNAIEAENDSMRNCMLDVLEMVEKFQTEIEDVKRLRREKVEQLLEDLSRTINGYV